ncbi:SDR family oxidoreductase [Candidatus Pelagibacter sp.]|nr:SDR family oxidoreductase [Candidatus Pelagibacter sp.]
MKNLSNKKEMIIGILGARSALSKEFVKFYKKKIKIKIFKGDITNQNEVTSWLNKNYNLNVIINFAAITSKQYCQKNKKKAMNVNCKSVIQLLHTLNNLKLSNFKYFLSISTSHVFKPTNNILKENSIKKPSNYYGITKLSLERFILKNHKKFNFTIGIARIFNFFIKNSKKNFFINDVIRKLKNKSNIVKFSKVSTYRDYISIYDINTALYRMVNLNLKNDYNICSNNKIYLPDIISKLNTRFKNKKIIFDKNKSKNIIGSNIKLKNKGWSINKEFFNEI